MSEIEQLRALLGKLPNPTEALELLDKVAAVPGVVVPPIFGVGRDAENPRALIVSFSVIPTDDELRAVHDCLSAKAHAAALQVVGEPVAWAVSIRDGTYRVTRDSLISAGCARSGCTVTPLHPAPAESIPRARLDELLAAEKRVQELESAFAVLEGLSPLECMNLKTCAENGEWSVRELLIGRAAALTASKGGA